MIDRIINIIYMVLYIIAAIGRAPYAHKVRKMKAESSVHKVREYSLLLLSLPMMVLPLIYIFSDWLTPYNINLHLPIRIIGGFGFAYAVYLHNACHSALGTNWSPILEIKKEQSLITGGPYKYIRHPMYSAFLLWSLSQGIFLSNWLILTTGFAGFLIIYLVRVPDEEKMMKEKFGKEYTHYMKKTGKIFPKLI